MLDRLEDLARLHGLHATDQLSLRLEGPDGSAQIASIMASLRSDPPAELGGLAVEATTDLLAGTDLPPTDALVVDLEDDARVVVRPSGTEPKLKVYLEVVQPQNNQAQAQTTLEAIKSSLSERFNAQ